MSINVPNSNVQKYRTAPVLAAINGTLVLKRVDDGFGGSAVAPATGAAGEDIVGISHVRPLQSSTKVVVAEEHTGNEFNLNHAGVIGAVAVYNVTKGAAVAKGDITVAGSKVTLANGDETDIVEVTYTRSLTIAEITAEGLPLESLNLSAGTDSHVEFATGQSTVDVDNFDPEGDYAVGAPLYANADGVLTSIAPANDSPIVGRVASVPQGEYPWLSVSGNWVF